MSVQGSIYFKNTTGKRSGSYVRIEYGEDLFGFLYLDVTHGRKHKAKLKRTMVFNDTRDFICTLDWEIYKKETLNYYR